MVECAVCRRSEPTYGAVCATDRDRIADGLGDLLRNLYTARAELVPAARGLSDRVSSSRSGAPLPARLDVLSLTGPGNVAVTAWFHPLIRRWSTQVTVTVTVVVGGEPVAEDRTLVEWHCEPVLDEYGRQQWVPANDQVGPVPPAEWADSWVRAWRRHFGHRVPPRTRRTSPPDAARTPDLVRLAADPVTSAACAALLTIGWAYRRDRARTVLGQHPGHGGRLPPSQRAWDPVADELATRFGPQPRDWALETNITYLLTWLDRACEDDVGIAAFAAELRALTAELDRVLGNSPDQQWLGRCPATLTARDGESRACGAGLWQDPHASQVQCPHCHATWGPRRGDLLHLSAEIRRVWPVDRRRHYSTTEISCLPPLRCPTCAAPADVTWRDVTAAGDDRRRFRPVGVICPTGCPDAARALG